MHTVKIAKADYGFVRNFYAVSVGKRNTSQIQHAVNSTPNNFSPKPDRDRLLLLNKREILKLRQQVEQKGLTIVPIKAYFNGERLKLEIGIGKGKKNYNKKEDKKEQDIKRETQRLLAER